MIAIATLCSGFAFSQTTITLYPSKDAGIATHTGEPSANTNYGNALHNSAFAISGTHGGLLANRGLIDYDLSSIPQGASILDAQINLYAFNAHSNALLQPGHYGNNSATLRRVIEAWAEYTVTWNNQPQATSQNEVILPQSTSANQDYTTIDVTTLVQDMVDNPTTSHGFKLQLINEVIPTNLSFHSKEGTDSTKYAKLVITYDDCRQYNLVATRDASIAYHDFENSANTNYGSAPHCSAFAIDATIPSGLLANRAVIDFDLSQIAPGSIIDSALISLYAFNGHSNPILQAGHFGNNSVTLRRTIEQWNENTATWNNQANATTLNEVILPMSDSANQDYINVDVTALVQDMVNNPSSSFGFKMQLVNEQKSRSLSFHSKDGADTTKYPTLRVIVNCSEPLNVKAPQTNSNFLVYPNPSSNQINVKFETTDARHLYIYSVDGKLIQSIACNTQLTQIDVSSYSKGIYLLQSDGKEGLQFQKFVVR